MKKKYLLIMLALLAMTGLITGNVLADSAIVNFGPQTGSMIYFVGTDIGSNLGVFGFTGPDDHSSIGNFQVTSSTGGLADGFHGAILGLYGIGPITILPGGVEEATVTPIGVQTNNFYIFDGTDYFTAHVDWMNILTVASIGGLNTNLSANVSDVNYTGTNADLLALKALGDIATVSFQFTDIHSLVDLTADGTTHSTSYSGSISAVPLPPSMLLLGTGLLRLGFLRWRKKSKV